MKRATYDALMDLIEGAHDNGTFTDDEYFEIELMIDNAPKDIDDEEDE